MTARPPSSWSGWRAQPSSGCARCWLQTMLAASPRRRWRRWATPDYAPPEMLTDDVTGIEAPRQSPAIDVFATASVLFELACARLPFGEKGAMSASPYRLKAEGAPTPASVALDGCNAGACAGVTPCLGLVRVCEGYVMGQPHWVDPAGAGCVDGSLATDDSGLCNVEADVSSRHLRVWFAEVDKGTVPLSTRTLPRGRRFAWGWLGLCGHV